MPYLLVLYVYIKMFLDLVQVFSLLYIFEPCFFSAFNTGNKAVI